MWGRLPFFPFYLAWPEEVLTPPGYFRLHPDLLFTGQIRFRLSLKSAIAAWSTEIVGLSVVVVSSAGRLPRVHLHITDWIGFPIASPVKQRYSHFRLLDWGQPSSSTEISRQQGNVHRTQLEGDFNPRRNVHTDVYGIANDSPFRARVRGHGRNPSR